MKIDSAAYAVDVVCRVSPGARLRIASLDVTGTRSVPPRLVTRQLALRPGDVVSRGSLAKGRANLQSVALFRRADVTLGAVGSDSLVPVKVAVTEGSARFTNLELGYVTDGAASPARHAGPIPASPAARAAWTPSLLVQTGWGATGSEVPDDAAARHSP